MHAGKRILALGIAAFGATLVGCVTMGRPLPEARPRPVQFAQGPEIPLVPVPPPPLGQPEKPPVVDMGKPIASAPPASTPPPATTPPTVVETPPPPPGTAPAPTSTTARGLHQAAQQRIQTIDSYIVRLIRREMVKGEMNPEEVILFKFRKEPWSIYFKWLGKEGQGREVVYVKGRHEGKIHTLLAAGDIPLMPAGRRMALAPDNILVKSATRHPITEAGIAAAIDRIGGILSAIERGDRKVGTMTVAGSVSRPEFEKAVHTLEHLLPAGTDASLPHGGRRTYFFDPDTNLPMLIIARDERGQEVEYYRYDRLQAGVKLDDADFDPDRLWARPKTAAARR